MDKLTELGSKVLDCLPDKASPLEIYDANQGVSQTLESKVEKANQLASDIDRLRDCRSASDVFVCFARDAAISKVVEMTTARSSEHRQRAAETILNYSLGKPIERRMNIDMHVTNASDRELDDEISRLLAQFGFQGGQGKTSTLLVDPGRREEPITVEELPSESGVAGESLQKSGED